MNKKFRICIKSGDGSKEIIYFGNSSQFMIGLDGTIYQNYGRSDSPFWESVFDADVTLQQWTGLLDKNGREIYEGDILLLTSNCYEDQTCQVKFGQGIFDGGIYKYAGFYLEKGGKILEPYEVTSLIDKSGLYKYEIIGNIFETPDL